MTAIGAGEAVTHPEIEAAFAKFERALTEQIAKSERRVIERTTVLLWRLFGGMVAVFGLGVAAFRYLP